MVRDVHILVEAFQYAERFRGRHVVVKLGGASAGDEAVAVEVMQDLVWMHQWGIHPLVVHGGGPQIDAALAELGIQAVRVEGIRVTDGPTLQVVQETLGKINEKIVEKIKGLAGEAIGFSGAQVFLGRPLSAESQFTGEVTEVKCDLVRSAAEGSIVVLSCLASEKGGQVLNVNADFVAVALSSAVKAEKLILLTDVPGVLLDPMDHSTLISTLTESQAKELLRKGTVGGGMAAKVKACIRALSHGVHKAHIIHAAQAHSLLAEIFTDEGAGTQIIHDVDGASALRQTKS